MKILAILAALLLGTWGEEKCAPWTQPLAQRRRGGGEGAARLLGLVDVHEGDRCHLLSPGGVEQLMLTIAEVEQQLMIYDLTQVEFDLHDTCSNTSVAISYLMRELSKDGDLKNNCDSKPYLGVIGPGNASIQEEIKSLLKIINVPYFPMQLVSLKAEIEAIVKVLLDLNWKSVALFSSTKALEDEFHEEADRNNICIAWSAVIPPDADLSPSLLDSLATTGARVGVVLGSSTPLDFSQLDLRFVLQAGSGGQQQQAAASAVHFRRATAATPARLDPALLRLYAFGGKVEALKLADGYLDWCEGACAARIPAAAAVAEAARRMVDDLNGAVRGFQNGSDEIWRFYVNETSNETLPEVEIWTFQDGIGKFSKPKEIQVGHYSNGHLIWDKKRLDIFHFTGSGWFKIPEFHCQLNCRELCTNFANISLAGQPDGGLFGRIALWKHETWVTVLLTLSGVGGSAALVAAAYLTAYSCREHEEGGRATSRATSFVVLAAVVFAFGCSSVFALHEVGCSKRIAAVGVAHAALVAPLLARCFVLFAAEMDGIRGHVSGFLQTVLTMFVFAVQLAMAAYHWAMMSGEPRKYRCLIRVKPTMAYLSYPLILVVSWLIVSPFCIRIRRNHREGLLLHLGSLAACGSWALWLALFFALAPRWREFALCLGLVGEASALLVVLFLPRVHRAVARGQQGSTPLQQQPGAFASTSSNLSIYESINHGYAPDKDVYVVDAYREEEESPGLRSMTHL